MVPIHASLPLWGDKKGIPDVAIQAALDELGLEEIPYQRDYFGRIIAPNFDAFGKPVYKQGPLSK